MDVGHAVREFRRALLERGAQQGPLLEDDGGAFRFPFGDDRGERFGDLLGRLAFVLEAARVGAGVVDAGRLAGANGLVDRVAGRMVDVGLLRG